jgi:hypothetical protein
MSRNFCRLNGNVWRIFSKGESVAEEVMHAIEKKTLDYSKTGINKCS